MRDYENITTITSLVGDYRSEKKKERTLGKMNDDKLAEALKGSGVQDSEIESMINTYNSVQVLVDDIKKTEKTEKSNSKERQEYLLEQIKQVFMQEFKKEDFATDKVALPKVATLTFEKKKEMRFVASDEKKREIIEMLVDEGMVDMLALDVDAYLKFAQEMKDQQNISVEGVTEIVSSNLSIRCS